MEFTDTIDLVSPQKSATVQLTSARWRRSLLFHTVAVSSIDLVLALIAGALSFLLRFEFHFPQEEHKNFVVALAIWGTINVVVFSALRLRHRSWRYVSLRDAVMLVYANLLAAAIAAFALQALGLHRFPRSTLVLEFVLTSCLMLSVRCAVRGTCELTSIGRTPGHHRALIYGAGEAGLMLLRELRANRGLGYSVVGFIDDDLSKQGLLLQGIRVLGGGEQLAWRARNSGASDVLIAVPSAKPADTVKILRHCAEAKLRFRTVPSLADGVRQEEKAAPVREVRVEDLLGRTPVVIDDANVRGSIAGQRFLVTGAAGSIGSELCRQIARFQPAMIVAYDSSETGLFYLERDLARSHPQVTVVPVVGNVRELPRLRELFAHYGFSGVFHAAAYKHVPMMELHPFEAFENNVVGTYNLAETARAFDVPKFLMISTDKAVRPTSIMGLSKRAAEIVVASMHRDASPTEYVSVRFGNVLGSNGSVVPIFREQIAAGGPVTVTHPEMRRYFMSIPEAVQLVLQASIMGHNGEIMELDMGDPVRIVELAENMILLSGKEPNKDVRIEFTGMRPGEKLCEDLRNFEEETLPTHHDKIRVLLGRGPLINDVDRWVESMRTLSQARDYRLFVNLKHLVNDYSPSAHIMERLVSHHPLPTFAPNVPPSAQYVA